MGTASLVPVVDSPSMGTCKAEVKVGLGIGNATISAAGTDAPGATACKTFINAIATSGLHVHFTNVKFQGTTLPLVDVILAGP